MPILVSRLYSYGAKYNVHLLAVVLLWIVAEIVEQEFGVGLIDLQLLPGLLEVEDVDGLAEHLHLFVEMRDRERLLAAFEIGDAEEALLRLRMRSENALMVLLPGCAGARSSWCASSAHSRTSTARSP
jgi:hypothetical protein